MRRKGFRWTLRLPDLHQVALGRYEQGVKKPPDPTGFSKGGRPYPSSCRNSFNLTKRFRAHIDRGFARAKQSQPDSLYLAQRNFVLCPVVEFGRSEGLLPQRIRSKSARAVLHRHFVLLSTFFVDVG